MIYAILSMKGGNGMSKYEIIKHYEALFNKSFDTLLETRIFANEYDIQKRLSGLIEWQIRDTKIYWNIFIECARL